VKLPFRIILLSAILLFVPFTLHSTDIFVSSHGEVKILANLNPHIVPGHPKLGNTVLVVSAPNEREGIRLVTPCEHTESILHTEPRGTEETLFIIRILFPVSCDIPSIRVGDREHIFTDSLFPLPVESFRKLESSLINSNDSELLNILRTTPISTGETK